MAKATEETTIDTGTQQPIGGGSGGGAIPTPQNPNAPRPGGVITPRTGVARPIPITGSIPTQPETPDKPSPEITPPSQSTVPDGYVKAKQLSECYNILGLKTTYSYTFNVGKTNSVSREIIIQNKTLDNPILFQFYVPIYLNTNLENDRILLQAGESKTVILNIDSLGAMNVVFERKDLYSEPMDIYVNIFNVTGPVYVKSIVSGSLPSTQPSSPPPGGSPPRQRHFGDEIFING